MKGDSFSEENVATAARPNALANLVSHVKTPHHRAAARFLTSGSHQGELAGRRPDANRFTALFGQTRHFPYRIEFWWL
jgi:hypothetical protein